MAEEAKMMYAGAIQFSRDGFFWKCQFVLPNRANPPRVLIGQIAIEACTENAEIKAAFVKLMQAAGKEFVRQALGVEPEMGPATPGPVAAADTTH